MNTSKPYNEKRNGNTIYRNFSQDIDESELIWHRDKEDRYVKVLNESDWGFQMDNELPIRLKKGTELFIPKETYHRVLKGRSDLNILIKEGMEISIGVNINDDSQPFTDLILNGEKTIETRNTPTLRPYVGKRVGIISTSKKRKAKLVGYIDIVKEIEYTNEKQFDSDYNKHLVDKDSPFYIKDIKYGYVLTNPERIEPRDIDSKGIISRSLIKEAMELQDEELTAYHGSPYSFKKFSTQKMGTGEGAQAFGWGLYFTDLEDIARQYTKAGEGAIFIDKTPLSKRARFQKLPQDEKIEVEQLLRDIANGELTRDELFGMAAYRKGDFLTAYNFIRDAKEVKFSPEATLYKVSLHKGKTPEQYTWLEWDKIIDKSINTKLIEQAKKEGILIEREGKTPVISKVPTGAYFTNDNISGQDLYENLTIAFGSDKEASLFLLRAGIDGIKYPAESIARGATSDTARGFNYVVFDENAVSIEKQTQLEEMEVSKKDLIQNWLNNPKKLKEDAEDANFMEEITKSELEEAKKARTKLRKKSKGDRCTRIAKSKYDVWPSAYASGAVVKCRQGKIWKGLNEEEEESLDNYPKELIKKAHDAITRIKGRNHAPTVHEIQAWIDKNQESLDEKWSEKYKRSIDCNNPKGFSQKAHCKGRLKEEEQSIDKRKIYVLVGPPSVGKSTWIKNTFGDIQPYVISRDDIVEQVADNLGWSYDDLFVAPPQGSQLGDYDEKYGEVIKSPSYMSWQPLSFSKVLEANNQVHVTFTKRVSNAVNSGKDIVVDMTNMTAGARKNALKAIEGSENLFEKIAVVFPFQGAEDVIIDVARKRAEAAKRMGKSKTLPDSVMRKMFASFQDVSPEEGFDKVVRQDNRELLSTLNEEIDASEAYEVDSAIQTVIDRKRNVGLVDLDSTEVEDLKQKGINLIPVFPEGSDIRNQYTKEMSGWGESGAKHFADRSYIIYNNEGKQDAIKLYNYMKSHKGFVSDSSPQEAMYVGKLLGYSDSSIEDYINRKYNINEKTDFSKEKEQGLHGWFARQGGKGKSKGWVDCNTCRDGKCKSCGRKEGESRSKYPACRPTPSACKSKGKGDSWGKKNEEFPIQSLYREKENMEIKKRDMFDEDLVLKRDQSKNAIYVQSDLDNDKARSQETFKNKEALKGAGFKWDGDIKSWKTDDVNFMLAKKTIETINKKEYLIDKLEQLEEIVASTENSPEKDTLMGKIDMYINDLSNATDEAAVSAEIRRYLTFFSKFRGHSLFNTWLIYIQSGGKATKVAGFRQWEAKFHRRVKKGAKGLQIFVPIFTKSSSVNDETGEEITKENAVRFKPGYVFDISDTEAIDERGDVPQEPNWFADLEPTERSIELYKYFIELCEDMGIQISKSDSERGEKGYSAGNKINISSAREGAGEVSTLVHEIAHELMHWKKSSIYFQDKTDAQLRELQAESVSYVVLKHYELPTEHHPTYLALWKANKDKIKANLKVISDVASFIISEIDKIERRHKKDDNTQNVLSESRNVLLKRELEREIKLGEIKDVFKRYMGKI